jgi:hypothetical protein
LVASDVGPGEHATGLSSGDKKIAHDTELLIIMQHILTAKQQPIYKMLTYADLALGKEGIATRICHLDSCKPANAHLYFVVCNNLKICADSLRYNAPV